MIASFHAQAIEAMDGSSVVAIYARRQKVAEELAIQFNCKAYSNENEFFADPEIEVITIATPSGAHLEPAVKAAKAGKHIICEKPIEVTTDRIDKMITAAQEAGVTLSGVFNRRFNPAVAALKAAIEKDRFGNIALTSASIPWWRDPDYYSTSNWKGTWKLDGGGALINQGIHTIEQLIYFLGPVKRVAASATRAVHKGIEVEDTAVAILEYENGARGVIQGSTACWSTSGNPSEISVFGEYGSVILSHNGFRQWDFRTESPEDKAICENLMIDTKKGGAGANNPAAITPDSHSRNFQNVVDAIVRGESPSIEGHEARKGVELICAIYESAQSDGKPINL